MLFTFLRVDPPEVDFDSWNASPGFYAFRYFSTEGGKHLVFIECTVVDDTFVIDAKRFSDAKVTSTISTEVQLSFSLFR